MLIVADHLVSRSTNATSRGPDWSPSMQLSDACATCLLECTPLALDAHAEVLDAFLDENAVRMIVDSNRLQLGAVQLQ